LKINIYSLILWFDWIRFSFQSPIEIIQWWSRRFLFLSKSLCLQYTSIIPKSIELKKLDSINFLFKEFYSCLFNEIDRSISQKACSIYQALCLPVSVQELLQANQLGGVDFYSFSLFSYIKWLFLVSRCQIFYCWLSASWTI